MQGLNALNKSSGRFATFAVRLCGGRVVEYTYKNKKDNQMVTAHKFEVWLVGTNPQEYCIGYVKGNKTTCTKAKQQHTDACVCALSKVVFDTFCSPAYISTPIPYRVDLAKSQITVLVSGSEPHAELIASMPTHPVPPRSVADVASITTNRSTDLIAMIKSVSNKRKSKAGEEIVDLELVDNSKTTSGRLATIVVSVFGASKIQRLSKGARMALFNLSVACGGRDGKPNITHYPDEVMEPAPDCEKTSTLLQKQEDLSNDTNTDKLTAVWTPSHHARDVSGLQPLSCAAFLDYTSENPNANLPEVTQIMWVHIEEPDPAEGVVDNSGERLWYRVLLRDVSGSVLMGIPQRCALVLANCSSMEEFTKKHADGELNMPLLCQARVSRVLRGTDGATQPVKFVNHTLEMVEPVSWQPSSAPNAAFTEVLAILKNCPPHDEGIHFAFLADVKPDPHYGMRLVYDGEEGPKGIYVAALIASNSKSKTDRVGDDGYKVVTTEVKDIANPEGSVDKPIGNHTLVGYCSMASLPGFSLDPPRGKTFRVALALLSSADDKEGLHIHKLEYIEPEQVQQAVVCMQKLRALSKRVRSVSSEKRSHSLAFDSESPSPCDTKKARTLHSAPTEASLPAE